MQNEEKKHSNLSLSPEWLQKMRSKVIRIRHNGVSYRAKLAATIEKPGRVEVRAILADGTAITAPLADVAVPRANDEADFNKAFEFNLRRRDAENTKGKTQKSAAL